MKYLLDTNLIIDAIRKFQPTIDFMEHLLHFPNSQAYLSSITNLELHLGRSAKDPNALQEINLLINQFKAIDVNLKISGSAGELVRELSIDTLDAVIAATAINYDLILVTKNRKHFTKIKDLKLISP